VWHTEITSPVPKIFRVCTRQFSYRHPSAAQPLRSDRSASKLTFFVWINHVPSPSAFLFLVSNAWNLNLSAISFSQFSRLSYRLDDPGIGIHSQQGKRFFSSPQHPDQFWSSPSLLSSEYPELFPPWVNRCGRETHLYLLPMLRILYLHTPIRSHGVVLN
jgi:hypothetical protein